jgi:hypothetical protein
MGAKEHMLKEERRKKKEERVETGGQTGSSGQYRSIFSKTPVEM